MNSASKMAQERLEEQKPPGKKWVVFVIVAAGIFMVMLDSSIVSMGLPTIALYYGVPLSGAIEWVLIAYLVALVSVLMTAARLADMIGQRIVWSVGAIIFTVSSAMCGAAPSLGILIAARFLQGIGGALMMSVTPALLAGAFPAHERGRAFGLNTVTISVGTAVGPTVGGFIIQSFSWHWIFYVNVPIGIVGLILAWYILAKHPDRNPGRFDPLGALLLATGLASLTAGLSFAQELGWSSPPILASLFVGVIMLAILPFVEMRVPNPVIALSLVKNRVFALAVSSWLLHFLAVSGVSFILPFYLQELHGFPIQEAGLLLTPYPLMLAVVSLISGSLADRFGTLWLRVGGMVVTCIGLIVISQLDEHSSVLDIIWSLGLIGAGQALFQPPNASALMGSAPRELQGSASGIHATGRNFGNTLGTALTGAIFVGLGGAAAGQTITTQYLSGDRLHALQQTFVYSFRITFLASAAIAAIGIFTSLDLTTARRRTTSTKTEESVPKTIPLSDAIYTDEAFEAFDVDFAEEEQAGKPITEEVHLLWFNGLLTNTSTMAIGWHIEAGINLSLDEVMEGMGVHQYLVHMRSSKGSNKTEPKPYWHLREASLIIIAKRLQSPLEMNRSLQDRIGLAYAREPVHDEQGQSVFVKQGKQRQKKVLKMRVFVHELVRQGYSEWFPVTLSGYDTDPIFDALIQQYRVLEYYSAYRREQGKNAVAPFYLFSLPTAPGAMRTIRASPDQGSIYPITARVPKVVDKVYLRHHLIPMHLVERIREHVLDEAVVWSIEESISINQGRAKQEKGLALNRLSDEVSNTVSAQEADPLIQQSQVAWLVRQYCKEDQRTISRVCEYFGVSRLEHLRMSQFRMLVGQRQAAMAKRATEQLPPSNSQAR